MTKIYKTQKEIEADIKDGVLVINGDVTFECSFEVEANIVVRDGNIKARNIDARNIKAWDISFYAVAFAYESFRCKSVVGRRENSRYFCLDNGVEIIKH